MIVAYSAVKLAAAFSDCFKTYLSSEDNPASACLEEALQAYSNYKSVTLVVQTPKDSFSLYIDIQ